MKIGIIVSNWNNYEDTKECLISIKKFADHGFKLVVVDGGSTDNSTKQIQNEFPEFDYLYLKEDSGYAKMVNAGVKYFLDKKFDWILVTNNDVLFTKSTLAELIKE